MLAFALATFVPAAASPDVATLLFDRPMWRNAPAGATLRYHFERKADRDSFDDDVVLLLGKGDDAESRNSTVTMFSGSHARAAGPFVSGKVNPILLLVLEQNVQELAQLAKVEPLCLKNAIRKAWRDDAKIVDTPIDLGGELVEGTRITVTPFQGEAERRSLGAYAGMSYTVEISDRVPGMIALVAIRASGNKPSFGETLRYVGVKPR